MKTPNFTSITLPYIPPRSHSPKVRPYRVMLEDSGVITRVGPAFCHLNAALRKAESLTLACQGASACVVDITRPWHDRVLHVYRRGVRAASRYQP